MQDKASTSSGHLPHRDGKSLEEKIKPWKLWPQEKYIFQNANVIDPTDGSIRKCTVTTSGGMIESVEETGKAGTGGRAALDATTVDLNGRFICPGLIDSHVHLVAVPGFADLGKTFSNFHDVSLLRQPFVCRQILSRGFTTVRDCGGALLALKEAIAENVFPGPRLFISGHALSQTGGHGDLRSSHDHTMCCGGHTNNIGRLCDGVAECTKAVREEIREGADFIKMMAGGGVASPTDKIEHLQFTAEEVRAITTAAANAGTYVTAHAYTPASIRQAIENGVMGIEHGNLMTPEIAKLMAEKGAFLTPTLVTYEQIGSPEWPDFLPPESAIKNQTVLKAGLESLKIARDAGVTMCYGTDLLGPLTAAQTKEFSIRAQVLSPLALLQSATINPARMLRQEKFLGKVEEGFAADLLILNENPLDDINVFDRPEDHLLAVMKDGRVYKSRWSKLPEDFVGAASVIE